MSARRLYDSANAPASDLMEMNRDPDASDATLWPVALYMYYNKNRCNWLTLASTPSDVMASSSPPPFPLDHD